MAKVIVATQGNFAANLNAALGASFEEINFSDTRFPNPTESDKSERNVSKVASVASSINFAIIDGGHHWRLGNLDRMARTLVDEFGVRWAVIAPVRSLLNPIFGVLGLFVVTSGESIKSATKRIGYEGFLIDRLGGIGVVSSRLIAEAWGLLWPAWLRRDGNITSRLAYMMSCTDAGEWRQAWGVWYNRLIPCGTPPGHPRRTTCDENDMTPSLAECLWAPKKILIYVQDSSGVVGQPPITLPPISQPPGPIPIPQPEPWPIPQQQPRHEWDEKKILVVGGIAFLLLMGIILLGSD